MDAIKSAEGMKRKGVVLATITRLKQVCNHPAQLLRDNSPLEARSASSPGSRRWSKRRCLSETAC